MLRKQRRRRYIKIAIVLVLLLTLYVAYGSAEEEKPELVADEYFASDTTGSAVDVITGEDSISYENDELQSSESQGAIAYVGSNEYTGVPEIDQEEIYDYLAGTWYQAGDTTKTITFGKSPDQKYSYVFSQKENGDLNIETYIDGKREGTFKILYNDDGKYASSFEIMCAYVPSDDTVDGVLADTMEEKVWVRSEDSMKYSESYEKQLQDADKSPAASSNNNKKQPQQPTKEPVAGSDNYVKQSSQPDKVPIANSDNSQKQSPQPDQAPVVSNESYVKELQQPDTAPVVNSDNKKNKTETQKVTDEAKDAPAEITSYDAISDSYGRNNFLWGFTKKIKA